MEITKHLKLAVFISGFTPRDENIQNICQRVLGKNLMGIPTDSLHIFSEDDEVCPPVASIEAMSIFQYPKYNYDKHTHIYIIKIRVTYFSFVSHRMVVRTGGHEVPSDCQQTLEAIENKFQEILSRDK
jgi:hypothetical protein